MNVAIFMSMQSGINWFVLLYIVHRHSDGIIIVDNFILRMQRKIFRDRGYALWVRMGLPRDCAVMNERLNSKFLCELFEFCIHASFLTMPERSLVNLIVYFQANTESSADNNQHRFK